MFGPQGYYTAVPNDGGRQRKSTSRGSTSVKQLRGVSYKEDIREDASEYRGLDDGYFSLDQSYYEDD